MRLLFGSHVPGFAFTWLLLLTVALSCPAVATDTAKASAPDESGRMELVMFEEYACPWCEQWDKDIGGIYDKTDEGKRAPLRRVDLHGPIPTDLTNVRRAYFTPTFVLVADGREVGRIRGYPGPDFFFPLLQELLAKHEEQARP